MLSTANFNSLCLLSQFESFDWKCALNSCCFVLLLYHDMLFRFFYNALYFWLVNRFSGGQQFFVYFVHEGSGHTSCSAAWDVISF